jgi:hypothetical protein
VFVAEAKKHFKDAGLDNETVLIGGVDYSGAVAAERARHFKMRRSAIQAANGAQGSALLMRV